MLGVVSEPRATSADPEAAPFPGELPAAAAAEPARAEPRDGEGAAQAQTAGDHETGTTRTYSRPIHPSYQQKHLQLSHRWRHHAIMSINKILYF